MSAYINGTEIVLPITSYSKNQKEKLTFTCDASSTIVWELLKTPESCNDSDYIVEWETSVDIISNITPEYLILNLTGTYKIKITETMTASGVVRNFLLVIEAKSLKDTSSIPFSGESIETNSLDGWSRKVEKNLQLLSQNNGCFSAVGTSGDTLVVGDLVHITSITSNEENGFMYVFDKMIIGSTVINSLLGIVVDIKNDDVGITYDNPPYYTVLFKGNLFIDSDEFVTFNDGDNIYYDDDIFELTDDPTKFFVGKLLNKVLCVENLMYKDMTPLISAIFLVNNGVDVFYTRQLNIDSLDVNVTGSTDPTILSPVIIEIPEFAFLREDNIITPKNTEDSFVVGYSDMTVDTNKKMFFNKDLGSFGVGYGVDPSGEYSQAMGKNTKASNNYSHAEGYGTDASGATSHAEGQGSISSGSTSHAEGYNTTAEGACSHTEGYRTSTLEDSVSAHAEGRNTIAEGSYSHAEGFESESIGESSHAEGNGTTAEGDYSHAEGSGTTASEESSHAEGSLTVASGSYSHAEGSGTTASGESSHAEGTSALALGAGSHAEGSETTASGLLSHSEGILTVASGFYSHAEGSESVASGEGSHSEGGGTTAEGDYSHAEGVGTTAEGDYSHAEGNSSVSRYPSSHAFANGKFSVAGDAQGERLCAKVISNDSAYITLLELELPNNSVFSINSDIVGVKSNDTDICGYYNVKILVKCESNITFVNWSEVTPLNEDVYFIAGQIDISVVNNKILIKVISGDSFNTNWVGTFNLTEVII